MKLIKWKLVLIICFILLYSGQAFASSQIIEADGTFIMGDNDTRAQAREWALQDAKRIALEKAGTYLQSYTRTKDNQVAIDEVTAIASGIIRLDKVIQEEVNPSNSSLVLTIRARFKVNTDDLQKKIQSLEQRRDKEELLRQMKNLQQRYSNLLKENKQLKQEISKAPNNQTKKLLEKENKNLQDRFRASQLIEKGLRLFFNGNYGLAFDVFYEATILDNNYADAYYFKGLASIYAFSSYRANINTYDFSRAIEINPTFTEAYVNRGLAYVELGEYQKALDDLNKAISLKPSNPYAYLNRGVAYCNLKKYSLALNDFDKVIELNSELAPDAYCNKGWAYHESGNAIKAKENFQKAIKLNLEQIQIDRIPDQYLN